MVWGCFLGVAVKEIHASAYQDILVKSMLSTLLEQFRAGSILERSIKTLMTEFGAVLILLTEFL